MSTDIAARDVTSDAEPTMPREVQPVSHETPGSNLFQNDLCQSQGQSTTSEEMGSIKCSLTGSSTENTMENSDTQQNQQHLTAIQQNFTIPPMPPEDWMFNNLLLEISEYVTTDALEKFKSLFRGQGPRSYKKKKLQAITTCQQFFTILREDLYLSKDNTMYLQKFLYMLGNKDLIEKTIKYCQQEGTLYFYQADEEPVQGNTPVMFHVKGKGLDYFTPENVRKVRDTVAAILCIPHEHILIAGLKPSDSFLITLMIPDIYVDILQTMLKRNERMLELSERNVDYILINEKLYYTMVTDVETGFPSSEQQRKLLDAYKEMEDTQIETLQKELEIQREENDKLKSENHRLVLETSLFQKMDPCPTWETAVEELQMAIQEAERNKFDMKLLQHIIEANTMAVTTHVRYENDAQRERVVALWKQKQAYEKRLFHFLISKQKAPEEILILKYEKCTLLEEIRLGEVVTKVINDISTKVNNEERQILMKCYHWEDKDLIKACIDADKTLLILGLFCKETEKRQSEVSIEKFCSDTFERIQREDLFEMFKCKIKEVVMEMQLGNKETLMRELLNLSTDITMKFLQQSFGTDSAVNLPQMLFNAGQHCASEDNLD